MAKTNTKTTTSQTTTAETTTHKKTTTTTTVPTQIGTKRTPLLQLAGGCIADTCPKKSEKAGFCLEHFDWFKEGLITKEGRKPSDFEKKYFSYQQRKRAA